MSLDGDCSGDRSGEEERCYEAHIHNGNFQSCRVQQVKKIRLFKILDVVSGVCHARTNLIPNMSHTSSKGHHLHLRGATSPRLRSLCF